MIGFLFELTVFSVLLPFFSVATEKDKQIFPNLENLNYFLSRYVK